MSWKSELQSKIAKLRQKHSAQEAVKEQLLRYAAPLRAWPQGQQLGSGLGQQWQGAQIQPALCPDCAALPKLQSLQQDVIAAALLAPALVPRLRLYEAVVAASRELVEASSRQGEYGAKVQKLLALLHRLDTCALDAE